MLVLPRKLGERILVGENVIITALGTHSGTVRVGIEAPETVAIKREELVCWGSEKKVPPPTQHQREGHYAKLTTH